MTPQDKHFQLVGQTVLKRVQDSFDSTCESIGACPATMEGGEIGGVFFGIVSCTAVVCESAGLSPKDIIKLLQDNVKLFERERGT